MCVWCDTQDIKNVSSRSNGGILFCVWFVTGMWLHASVCPLGGWPAAPFTDFRHYPGTSIQLLPPGDREQFPRWPTDTALCWQGHPWCGEHHMAQWIQQVCLLLFYTFKLKLNRTVSKYWFSQNQRHTVLTKAPSNTWNVLLFWYYLCACSLPIMLHKIKLLNYLSLRSLFFWGDR